MKAPTVVEVPGGRLKNIALITGGAGFLGSHIAERLLRDGSHVICVDNFATGRRENLKILENFGASRFHFVEADVSKPWQNWLDRLPEFLSGQTKRVFHFASPASPPHYQRLNLETMWANSLGLENALRFATLCGAHVTFASTSEIYGDPEVSPQPESYRGWVNTWGPRSCYDEAKRFGESLIYSWNQRYKTQHGAVRIFNTYGPRMNPVDGRVIINFLVQALSDLPLTIYGSGQQTRSFCYVDDLVEGILAYSDRRLDYPVNIGNDHEFTILELVDLIRELFQERKQNLVTEFKELPTDDPRQRCPDLSLARKVLAPWSPKVDLKVGLARMANWLQEEMKI